MKGLAVASSATSALMKLVFRITSAAALSFVILACTPVGTNSTSGRLHAWTIRDELRIAMTASPNTLNPLLSTQETEQEAEVLAFDPLIAADPAGHDVPVLAARVPTLQNGDISRDGLTITYHLRHGVVWQDGAPFTSRDVAFSWRAVMNPNSTIVTRHGYDDVARVDTPDEYTAVFHLKRPFAPAVQTFFGPSDAPYEIVPAHLLERYKSLNGLAYNSQPVGTGPYRVVRWLRGDRIEYVANDRYFLGRPKIQHIVLHIIPNENTIVEELRAHEIDWFVQATPNLYPQLRTIAGIAVYLASVNGNNSILFNTTRAPWSDPRLRRAVGLALDKPEIVKKVTFATTVPATEDLPSFMWAFNPHAGTSQPNVAEANRLLDAAGWRLRSDGFRYKNGRRLTLELSLRNDNATQKTLAPLVITMLGAVGIDVSLKSYVASLYYGPMATGGILSSGKYQGGLFEWYAGTDPDDSSQFLCAQRPPNGYNWSRYCNSQMDVEQRIALTHYDRATRKLAYARIQQLLARDDPLVYLWWLRQIEAVNSDLKNFRPNGMLEDWNAYQWSF